MPLLNRDIQVGVSIGYQKFCVSKTDLEYFIPLSFPLQSLQTQEMILPSRWWRQRPDLEKCRQEFLLPLLSSIHHKDHRLSPLGNSGDFNILSIFTSTTPWHHCPPVSSILGHCSSHLSPVSSLHIQLNSTHMLTPQKTPSKTSVLDGMV